MGRVSVVVGAALVCGALAFAATGHAFETQARDVVPPNRPTERLIPVGTSTISGTVTAADTGRPIRGANVSINTTIGTPPSSGPLASNAIGTPARGPGAVGVSVAFVSRQAVTDAAGRFAIERLPAGSYTVNAFRQQFLNTNYGQRKPGGQGTPVAVGEGQSVTLSIALVRGGSISGTVFGEDGDPQLQTQVSAWRVVRSNGVKRVQQTAGGLTDDRGMYRLFGLQPGDYFVSATPLMNDRLTSQRIQAEAEAIMNAIASGAVRPPAGPGMPPTVSIPPQMPGMLLDGQNPPPGFLPTFAPNASVPSKATSIHVVGGDEHPNVDIVEQLVEASQILGTVTEPLQDGVGVQITLIPEESSFDVGSLPSARANQDGKFVLRNISPGKYLVCAQTVAEPQRGAIPPGGRLMGPPPQLTDAQHLWARAAVEVAGQSTIDVSLSLKPGKSISGTVVFDYASAPPPNLSQVRLNVTVSSAPAAQPMTFGPGPQAIVGPDGRFTVNGVIAGTYSLRVGGGLMKSSIVNGQDTLDFPVEFTGEVDIAGALITMTDAAPQVSGHVTDAAGKPALDYTIILASADERFWTPGSRRILTARMDGTGAYTLRNMPPGTYLLGAVSDLEAGGQYDPELLKSLRGASRTIVVSQNERSVQDLRVAR